jgi:hypothetical protein
LVTDAYAAYNAVNALRRQTGWSHIAARCKEILQQIEPTSPPIAVPKSVAFCNKLKRFASGTLANATGSGRMLHLKGLLASRSLALAKAQYIAARRPFLMREVIGSRLSWA